MNFFQNENCCYNAILLSAQAQPGTGSVGQTSEIKQTTGPDSPPARVSIYETRPKNISVNYIIKYR
uniref:Similarity n=1 Tax=Microcystis aeruginosa (strain PCC 7806) TaxID=267872 RepID=A8YDB2_MICA7|nr:unnamed protein product [Microcystis aeruginosa PCC 7806]